MKHKIRILHIDDDKHDRKLVKDFLKRESKEFEVIEADNREKFEKHLNEADIDLVLSDFDILGFDGLQVIQMVKAKDPDLPIIIVTGSGSEEIAIQAMKMGASDYIIKSVSHIRSLSPTIRMVLENKKAQEERKMLLATIHEREELYRSFYENMTVAILLTSPDGSILSANAFACKLFQRTEKEICEIGRNGLIDVKDPRLNLLLEERKNKGSTKGELTFIKKDGSRFQGEVSSVIFKDYEGRERTNMVIRDLSEQKESEQKLRSLYSRYEAILDSVPDIIMEVDNKKRYTWANNAGLHFFGDDVIGKEASHYFEGTQDTYEVVDPLFKGKKDNIIYVESLQRRQDGEIRLLGWWCRSLKDEKGKVIGTISAAQDITERRKAEQDLQESIRNYRELIDGMNETIWVIDFNGDLIDVNKSAVNKLGYAKEELISMGIQGIDSSLKKEQIRQLAESMPKDKIQVFETIHRAKDGRTFPVEVWSSLVTYQGKKAILSIARDITERKKTEEIIKREKQLLRSLIDNLPDAIYIKDQEGRKLIANKADLRIMKCSSEEEVIGKTDLELFDKENGEKGYAEDMSVIKTGKPILNHEDSYLDERGRERFRHTTKVPLFDGKGEIVGLVGFGHDITERKQAENELAWEQYLMHSLLDNIPDSIYFKDTESRFLRINKALAKKFDLDNPLHAIGKSDTDFFRSEHATEAYSDEQKIIETGNPIIAKEEVEMWADKPSTWISTTKMPLTNSKGEIIGTFGISRDIDKQKRAEEELIKAKEKAEESDKLKTAFLHNISHEIRTPMNAIIGFSELLYDRQLEDEKRNHYLDLIRQSSNQLLFIINDIVNISTIEAGQLKAIMKEFNLNRKLESIRRQFESEARNKAIELIIEPGLSEDESVIITDETKLAQVCINLMNNGIKFTKSGHVRLGYAIKDHLLEFFVEDTGIGIRPDLHEKIFERFRQADLTTTREYGGTGLGLTIAKAYINLLGGTIWLTSEPGKGTTFYFTIPIEVLKKPTVEHIEPVSGSIERDQPIVILVVEDEELNYLLIEEYLSDQQVSLLRATNGLEAIEYCRNYKSINLVLMDIKMPKMDGYEATRQIRTFNPTIPIIALTAHTQSEDMDNAIRAGCNMFISKPVKQNELIAIISNY